MTTVSAVVYYGKLASIVADSPRLHRRGILCEWQTEGRSPSRWEVCAMLLLGRDNRPTVS